jgi:SAM-dependent methyltransferase
MSEDTTWIGTMPEVYDRVLGPALFAPYAEHLASIAGGLAPTSILELAAGTGVATAALVRTLPDADVLATDLNPAMVQWGAGRVPAATWRQADAQHLDLRDADFDLVVCQFGVMFFPNKRQAFSEAARALRPGGALLLAIWDRLESSDFPNALIDALAAVLPDGPPDFVARVPHGYADRVVIGADLASAGFTDVRIDHVVLRSAADSAASLAEGFCFGTPLRFALEEQGSLEDLARRVGAEMTAQLGEGPVTGDLSAFVVSARRPE